MTYPIQDKIPKRRKAVYDAGPDLLKLEVGQSLFVPGMDRGYGLASRMRLKTGRNIQAMRDRQGDVEGTTFWRE